MSQKSQGSYSFEVRKEALMRMFQSNESIAKISQDLNISKSTLYRWRNEVGRKLLPESVSESEKEILDYILALVNLYGMVRVNRVVNAYNKQNHPPIDKETVAKYLENLPSYLSNRYVYVYRDYFVTEAIYLFDLMEETLAEKAGKPYYLPPKEELLKYCDSDYYEVNEAYKTFTLTMYQLFPKYHSDRLDEMILEVRDICALNGEMSHILSHLEMLGLELPNVKILNQLIEAISKLSNHTRIWENNGFTPNEIFERMEKDSLSSLPAEPFVFGQPSAQKTKTIGRNEPCPCGSGKKYKKCCLGNH